MTPIAAVANDGERRITVIVNEGDNYQVLLPQPPSPGGPPSPRVGMSAARGQHAPQHVAGGRRVWVGAGAVRLAAALSH